MKPINKRVFYEKTVREGCLPKEDQNNNVVLREVSLAAMIFNGGLITLPPVPRFIQMNETDERSSSHQETRHSRRVNSDAQSHRLAENKVTSFIRLRVIH